MSSFRSVCIDPDGNVVQCPDNLDPSSMPDKPIEIHFINIGRFVTEPPAGNEGESILIRINIGTDKEKNILYDAGSPHAGPHVLAYLSTLGVSKLDAMIASHPHIDHMGGFIPVLEAIKNGNLQGGELYDNGYARRVKFYGEYKALVDQLNGNQISYNAVTSEISIKSVSDTRSKFTLFVDDNFKFGEDGDGETYKSLIMKIAHNDATFLFMGDTRGDPTGRVQKSEYRIVQEYGDFLRSDVMKASEHGSKNGNTDTLLDVAKPGLIGISAKEGRGHPDPEAIARFDNRGIVWFSTTRDETFVIRTDGKRNGENVIGYKVEYGITDPS